MSRLRKFLRPFGPTAAWHAGHLTIRLLACATTLIAYPLVAGPPPKAPLGPTPPKIEAFLRLCETSRRGAILKLEHEVRGLERNQDRQPAAVRQLATAREQLRLLQANETPVVPPLAFPLQVGAIGRLPELSCHVDQVLGPQEMLARCQFTLKVITVERFRPRAETVVQSVPLLVRGLPTAEIQEGADITLTEVLEVLGKERRQTANGGTENLQVLTRFDLQSVMPYFERQKSQAK